jgi:DNA-binding HxlR family transcriptional regulator
MKRNSEKNENKGLRPGEIKILKALFEKPLNNKEIGEATGFLHQPNLLIRYLRQLIKIGLVERDNETRVYRIKDKGYSEETLFLNDIAKLIQSQVDKTICEKNSFSFGVGFCTVENNSEFLKQLETAFTEKPENLELLTKMNNLVSDAWHNFVLSSRTFDETARKIIRQAEQMTVELRKITNDEIEAKKEEIQYSQMAIIYKEGFKADIVNMEKPDQNCEIAFTLSEKEKRRYDEILIFLNDKKNQKIYEKWFNKEQNTPKTLLVFTPLGFSSIDYEEKIEKLLPRENDKKTD